MIEAVKKKNKKKKKRAKQKCKLLSVFSTQFKDSRFEREY